MYAPASNSYPMDDVGWFAMQYPSLSLYSGSNAYSSHTFTTTTSAPFINRFFPQTSGLELSGYLVSDGKTRDGNTAKYLEFVLQYKNIDITASPPFKPVTSNTAYSSNGVIKLSNIPFTVNAQEVLQFINRNSPIPIIKKHHDGYPIHIIMEKPTGKTMDCFVEFPSHIAAKGCAARFEQFGQPGRGTRLGSRNVTITVSTQAELMEAIFPRARLVKFDGWTGQPSILQHDADSDWTEGFRGYFTIEEIHGVIRFAENPSRSPFVLKAHQRVYECMISTLYKFPWAATNTYTVAARNALFEAAYKQLEFLVRRIDRDASTTRQNDPLIDRTFGSDFRAGPASPGNTYRSPGMHSHREVGLSQTLLFDLLFAALNVPVFSIIQKDALCQAAGIYGKGIELSRFSATWPFQVLEPVQGVPDDTIRFWLELYDTGFDFMFKQGIKTGFEEYLNFARNNVGFPIAEWTPVGVELMMADAVLLEMAVVSQYIDFGRQKWTQERRVDFDPMTSQSLLDTLTIRALMQKLVVPTGTHNREADEDEISPKSSRDLGGVPLPRSSTASRDVDSVHVGDMSKYTPSSRSKLNAATAFDFVPTSHQMRSSYGTVAPQQSQLPIDTGFVQPNATFDTLARQHAGSMPVTNHRISSETPTRPHALSTPSSSDLSSFHSSKLFSTQTSQGSGVKLTFDIRQPYSSPNRSGTSKQVFHDLEKFSFSPDSTNTQEAITNSITGESHKQLTQPKAIIAAPQNTQKQPIIALRESQSRPADVSRVNRELGADSNIEASSMLRSQRHHTLPTLQSPDMLSSIRPDFGPVGSSRTLNTPADHSNSGFWGKQNRSLSTPSPENAQETMQDREDHRGNGGRLSATELWHNVSKTNSC